MALKTAEALDPSARRQPLVAANPHDPVRAAGDGVLGAIGDTPLVRLRRYSPRPDLLIWAKLERANPGGGAKARPAAKMLTAAIERGELSPTGTVVESSSGNMGVGLAQACASLGLRLVCVTDSRANAANLKSMLALGADVRVISAASSRDGDLLAARLRLVAELLQRIPGAWWPNQYANRENANAHRDGTIREIDEALDGRLDFLFVATSTTGTLSGCEEYLRSHDRDTQLVAVDAVGSVLFGGEQASRKLPGMGASQETALSREVDPDRVIRIDELGCVVACRRLARREGILAGASSGAVLAAIDALTPELPEGASCAAVLADGGEGYLDTVYDDGWVASELDCGTAELADLVDHAPTPRSLPLPAG